MERERGWKGRDDGKGERMERERGQKGRMEKEDIKEGRRERRGGGKGGT